MTTLQKMTCSRGKQLLVAVIIIGFIIGLFIVVISLGIPGQPRPPLFNPDSLKVQFFAILTAVLIIAIVSAIVHRLLRIPFAQRPSSRVTVCSQCGQPLVDSRCPACER